MRDKFKELTQEDLQKATHLTAQYEAIKDVRKLFQPLLEAVGLNDKGIRRTTLMKKFGGFFSADGILDSFHIEIIKSADNPLQRRRSTHEIPISPQPDSDKTQLAFLCKKFSLNVSLRDFIHTDAKITKSIPSPVPHATSNITVILHIDTIRQHVNMPLLRLIHQFVTMTYISIDTKDVLEKKRVCTQVVALRKLVLRRMTLARVRTT
ncbi:hypothetical protein Ciccas_003115 [Cichlidogyrus casuarinus]|uniref:Bridge-like lipid transfer protein family member 1 middle region domain-containing protein n=1 Tax=Cichlidogyrus casuarinus TaxID=1844966 RepID=A0ABD2QFB1_9PLAT